MGIYSFCVKYETVSANECLAMNQIRAKRIFVLYPLLLYID